MPSLFSDLSCVCTRGCLGPRHRPMCYFFFLISFVCWLKSDPYMCSLWMSPEFHRNFMELFSWALFSPWYHWYFFSSLQLPFLALQLASDGFIYCTLMHISVTEPMFNAKWWEDRERKIKAMEFYQTPMRPQLFFLKCRNNKYASRWVFRKWIYPC